MSWRTARTHVSWLLFTDDRVYKAKRPVRLDFLDLSSPASRRRACRREVELNRRQAPDVYEGVGRFAAPDGSNEPVVVMRRMPEDRRLSRLVAIDDPDVGSALDRVAQGMASFHRHAGRGPAVDRHCRARAVESLWAESLTTVGRFPEVADAGLVARMAALATDYLSGRVRLLDRRVAAGHALDGHGDLLADDIFCLDDGPRILDCLEFDDRLRHLDPLADMASLAMDLERLGRPDLGRRLLRSYRHATADDWPSSLEHHWIAYRALVRANVACITWLESAAVDDAATARRLLDLAVDHLGRAEVRLVLVGGLPGAGKSTLASALARETGWALIRSDHVRKERGGDPSYDRAGRTAVYSELLARAEASLGDGTSVVLDATWSRPVWRARARALARRASARLVQLEARAPDRERLERAGARTRTGTDDSDAGPAVAAHLTAEWELWPEATPIDTAGLPAAAAAVALTAVGPVDA
ncbi:MAG TPA: AAA family ATPase [Acidimicrobiales bacterium]|nr:AAA family ATPase [Acidimicrobiales bacterium]